MRPLTSVGCRFDHVSSRAWQGYIWDQGCLGHDKSKLKLLFHRRRIFNHCFDLSDWITMLQKWYDMIYYDPIWHLSSFQKISIVHNILVLRLTLMVEETTNDLISGGSTSRLTCLKLLWKRIYQSDAPWLNRCPSFCLKSIITIAIQARYTLPHDFLMVTRCFMKVSFKRRLFQIGWNQQKSLI